MDKNVLVTGGAGFIGSNFVSRAIRQSYRVTVVDNLSRRGASGNLSRLYSQVGPFEFHEIDIRNQHAVDALFAGTRFDGVIHLAGQVAVTQSVIDPRLDFEVNATGTLNLLEAIRKSGSDPVFIYASTNKVYGPVEDCPSSELEDRYILSDHPFGISEQVKLDFHSPYGCSKGAGDQYVADYRRIYGLRSYVLRQSCIYGPGQLGWEEQGWVAWFAMCALSGRPITIYGDGKQVRDLLYIDDLVDLYFLLLQQESLARKFVYNIGGGPNLSASLHGVLAALEKITGRPIPRVYGDWRPGDQCVYISDIRLVEKCFGWRPVRNLEYGLEKLLAWAKELPALLSGKATG
jgi:CDP-paratose 2-epimerase